MAKYTPHLKTLSQKYLDAARDTWRLMKDRGFDAIINDLLIDNVLTMGSILIAYISAFLAYLYLKFTNPAYNSSGGFNAPIIAFGFLVGLQMVSHFYILTDDRRILRLCQSRVVLQRYSLQWQKILRRLPRTFLICIK